MYINIRLLVAVFLVLNTEFVQCRNDRSVQNEGSRRLKLQNRDIYEATDDKLRDYLGYYGNFVSEKDRNWCPRKCNSTIKILVSPNLSAYCTCNEKGETVHHQCKKFEIFNSTTSSCTPLLGNGHATCVLRNRTCPANRTGIEKHPNTDLYQNYIICMEHDVIVAKCEPNHYFKESQKSCVKIEGRKTVLSHSDCDETLNIKCTVAGITKLEDHPSFRQKNKCPNCYVICSERDKNTFDLMIQCNKRKRILPFLYDQPINDIIKIPEGEDKARYIKIHPVLHLETEPHEELIETITIPSYKIKYLSKPNKNKLKTTTSFEEELQQTPGNLEEEIFPGTVKHKVGHILIKKKPFNKRTKIPISVEETITEYDESEKGLSEEIISTDNEWDKSKSKQSNLATPKNNVDGADSEKNADNSEIKETDDSSSNDIVKYKVGHILIKKKPLNKRISVEETITEHDESEKGLSEEMIGTDNEWDKSKSTQSNHATPKINVHGADSEKTADNSEIKEIDEPSSNDTVKYKVGHIFIKKKPFNKRISVEETITEHDESEKGSSEEIIGTDNEWDKSKSTQSNHATPKNNVHVENSQKTDENSEDHLDSYPNILEDDTPDIKNYDEEADYEDISIGELGEMKDGFSVNLIKTVKNKKPNSKVTGKITETQINTTPKSEETNSNKINNTESYEDQNVENDHHDHQNNTDDFGSTENAEDEIVIEAANFINKPIIKKNVKNVKDLEEPKSPDINYDKTVIGATPILIGKPWKKLTKRVYINKHPNIPTSAEDTFLNIGSGSDTSTEYTTHDELLEENNFNELESITEVSSKKPVVELTIEKEDNKSNNPEILDYEISNDEEQITEKPETNYKGLKFVKNKSTKLIKTQNTNNYSEWHTPITDQDILPEEDEEPKTNVPDDKILDPITNTNDSEEIKLDNSDNGSTLKKFNDEKHPTTPIKPEPSPNKIIKHLLQKPKRSKYKKHAKKTKIGIKHIGIYKYDKYKDVRTTTTKKPPGISAQLQKDIKFVENESDHYFEEEHPINFETSAEQPLENKKKVVSIYKPFLKIIRKKSKKDLVKKVKHNSILLGKPSEGIDGGSGLNIEHPEIDTTKHYINTHTNKLQKHTKPNKNNTKAIPDYNRIHRKNTGLGKKKIVKQRPIKPKIVKKVQTNEAQKPDTKNIILVNLGDVNNEAILLKKQEKDQDTASSSCNVNKKDKPCPNKGFQRYKSSCSIHYECYYKKECNALVASRLYQCPHCLQFNAKKKRCDLPQNVPECTYHEEDEQKFKGHRLTVPVQVCSGPGIFKDPGNPNRYYKCLRIFKDDANYLTLVRCPTNKIFNDVLKKCVPGDKKHKMNRRIIEGGHKKGNYVFDKYSCWRFFHNAGGSLIELHCPDGYIFNGKTCENIKHSIFCNWEELKKYLYKR